MRLKTWVDYLRLWGILCGMLVAPAALLAASHRAYSMMTGAGLSEGAAVLLSLIVAATIFVLGLALASAVRTAIERMEDSQ